MSTSADPTLRQFLDAVAARQPAPGGGAVAAAAGALAAAMGEMVVNYSIGKKDLAAHQDAFAESLAHLHRARFLLLALMIEDQSAFAALTAARKSGDSSQFPAALLAAIRVPQSISATAVRVLEECEKLTPIANRYLLSDLAVCAELAMATIRCGAHNIRVNLADLPDSAERATFRAWCDDIVARSVAVVQHVVPAIWARVEGF